MGLTEWMQEATMGINSLDDMEPGKSAAIVLFWLLPVNIFLMNYITPNFNFGGYLLSKGNRFRWWELLFVVVGFTIDDYCTAIGMQAEEVPRSMIEGNIWMGGLMQWWIKQGFAKTETAAHRLTYIVMMAIISACQYMGWLTANSRVFLMICAAVKAYAGYSWCYLKPNNFGFKDFITFKDGRPTPERMSIPMLVRYNVEKGWMKYNKRRRLAETPNKGAAWIQRFLYTIFPI